MHPNNAPPCAVNLSSPANKKGNYSSTTTSAGACTAAVAGISDHFGHIAHGSGGADDSIIRHQ